MMPIRIVLADDFEGLRAVLRAMLEAEDGFQIVGEAGEGGQVLRLAAELQPDVVLLDLNMPGPGPIEVIRKIIEAAPKSKVLILTVHEESGMVREVMKAGASGYIAKRTVASELLRAIRAVHSGETGVQSSMTRVLSEPSAQIQQPSPKKETGGAHLTRREIEVLPFIVKGYTNRQTGESLKLSVRTVEKHRAKLMRKLEVQTRVELVRYAAEHQLLE